MLTRFAKLGLAIAVVAAITLFIVWRRPQDSPEPLPPASPAAESGRTEISIPPAPDHSEELANLKSRLAQETRSRQRAEAESAALREQLAPLQSNVVVSLGKVEDIGKRAGAFLPAMGELRALSGRESSTLSPEEKRRLLELQRQHAALLGALPEITNFQNNPEDYGRFFSSMIQQAAGLSDAQAAQVETYMRRRATEMIQSGLNAANEPTNPQLEEAWETRRDQFNEQTAHGLNAMLPPSAGQKAAISPELMEFLEMDFDKLNAGELVKKAE